MSQSHDSISFLNDNAKLGKLIHTTSLPAGWTCPGAYHCGSKADRDTGHVTDGAACQYRCFAVSDEGRLPSVRINRWRNFTMLMQARTREGMADLLKRSLARKRDLKLVRIHVGGDFFSQDHFDAWMDACEAFSQVKFYAYTKSLPFWTKRMVELPRNMNLTASHGGRFDHLIEQLGLKSAKVVMHPDEAAVLGIEVDHDDSHAYNGKEDFALLLHSTQPAGSAAAAAIKRLNQEKVTYGYSR